MSSQQFKKVNHGQKYERRGGVGVQIFVMVEKLSITEETTATITVA